VAAGHILNTLLPKNELTVLNFTGSKCHCYHAISSKQFSAKKSYR
jgi:hypothetical protein